MLLTVPIRRQSRLLSASSSVRHSSMTSPCGWPPAVVPSSDSSALRSMLPPPSAETRSTTIRTTSPAPPPTATPRPPRMPRIPRRSSTCVGSSFVPLRKSTEDVLPGIGSRGNSSGPPSIHPHDDVGDRRPDPEVEGDRARHVEDSFEQRLARVAAEEPVRVLVEEHEHDRNRGREHPDRKCDQDGVAKAIEPDPAL